MLPLRCRGSGSPAWRAAELGGTLVIGRLPGRAVLGVVAALTVTALTGCAGSTPSGDPSPNDLARGQRPGETPEPSASAASADNTDIGLLDSTRGNGPAGPGGGQTRAPASVAGVASVLLIRYTSE